MSKIEYNARIQKLENEALISVSELKASSILDYGISYVKILPHIVVAQQLVFESLVGSALYQKLQEPALAYEYQTLLDNYVYNFLIHLALAEYLNVAGLSVQEGGIYRHISSDSDPVTPGEIKILVKEEKYKAELYKKRMIAFIETYKEYYPEYTECIAGGIKARDKRVYTGGWNLTPSYTVSSKNLCPSCSSDMVNNSCTSDACGYDANMFSVEFYWGESSESDISFDYTALANMENKMPNYVTAQPNSEYYWIVGDKDFAITQMDIEIPLSTFADSDPLSDVYVKGELNGLYYIRIKILDSYEEPVQFGIKRI